MYSYSESPAAPPVFDLSGGHPVLDLINTLDHRFGDEGRVESLAGYDALLGFARQTGLLDPGQVRLLTKSVKPQAGARALRSVRELREALADPEVVRLSRSQGLNPVPSTPQEFAALIKADFAKWKQVLAGR